MALPIDSDRPLRGYLKLVELVDAITHAAADDESHAVEWKSQLDLGSLAGHFAVARTILGMANRPVGLASTLFEGVGYLVVGASAQGLVDIPAVDSAHLYQGIERYTGRDGPFWSQSSVLIDGKNVVVFMVEPPRAGDRLHTLAKEFTPEGKTAVPAGTIFVRKNGLTRSADPADVRELERRLLAGTQDPAPDGAVSWAGTPRNVVLIDDGDAATAQWISAERAHWMASLKSIPISMLANLGIGDRRTPSQYRAEVEKYLAMCQTRLAGACRDSLIKELEKNPWVLRFENTGEDVMTGVRVQIRLPDGIESYDGPSHEPLPHPPVPLGEDLAQYPSIGLPRLDGMAARLATNLNVAVQRDESGWIVRYDLGDVHPHEVIDADPVLFVGRWGSGLANSVELKAVITAGNRRSIKNAALELSVVNDEAMGAMELVGHFG